MSRLRGCASFPQTELHRGALRRNCSKMVKCPVCSYRLQPGTSSCRACGFCLCDDPSLLTLLLPEKLPAFQADPWSRSEGHENAQLPATTRTLRLTVARDARQVLFPLPIDEICLGRCGGSREAFPDLDLAPDGGFVEGVSRQHAKILQTDSSFFVEDVGSTNGTFLNDECIKPYLLYPLRAGDTLQLGRLGLLVEFDP